MFASNGVSAGGQTWSHKVRMMRQVVRIVFVFSLVLGLGNFAFQLYLQPRQSYQAIWYYGKCLLSESNGEKILVSSNFWHTASSAHYSSKQVSVSKPVLEKVCKRELLEFSKNLKEIAKRSLFIGVGGCSLLLIYFFIRGVTLKKKKHLSGNQLFSPAKIRFYLKMRGQASKIRVGPLPLVAGTETQHILISGGTGSGKTNCFHYILPQIRKAGERAVIVDTSGEFISKYYREGKDVILNPFDARSESWHPWAECKDKYDYDSLAQSFIPLSYNDNENYWRHAARAVFASLLDIKSEERALSEVADLLLRASLNRLAEALEGTKASPHLDSASDKTSGSIRSVAATFLDCLECIEDTKDPFSIRDWVKQEEDDGWLFLSTPIVRRSSMIPLLSTWFSVAMRALIEMEPKYDRRLWFIADELPSLNKLPDLRTCLTEGRKFGACGLFAIQSPAQLDMIYGHQEANTIIGNCFTKFAFAEQSPEVAERIAKGFGEKEILEFQEGISYGAHEMRDGVSLSAQNKIRPVISASDILALPKNEAFVRLPCKYSVSKIRLLYKTPHKIAESFLAK